MNSLFANRIVQGVILDNVSMVLNVNIIQTKISITRSSWEKVTLCDVNFGVFCGLIKKVYCKLRIHSRVFILNWIWHFMPSFQ
jgi:hypothetical protein